MNAERWQKAKDIFNAAINRKPSERASFLDKFCGDMETRREVESLLASHDEANSFLEKSPIENLENLAETKQLHISNGATFGHYEIIRQIGAGGMGEVYLAKDRKLDRQVAVKILNEKFAKDESSLRRFVQEAKAASALNQPNILVIYEIGETADAHYIVSEYVEGETLREKLHGKILSLSEILDIAVQIANALTAAHAARIVHRDIKPENIVVRPDGLVKILDFGLAKLMAENTKSLIDLEKSTVRQNITSRGLILGTVNYMSPEQAKGEPVDERTDIFSFGAVLYEMIAGRAPFAGGSVSETLSRLMNDEPPPLARFAPDAPPELQRIVSKTLRKNADERYQTAKGLLSDLKDLQRELEFQNKLETANLPPRAEAETKKLNAAADAPLTREKIAARKAKNFALTFGLLVLLLAAIGFGVWYFANRTADSRQIKSIAVLPFENKNSDTDTEYLSDGLAESLIYRLSQLPDLKVSPTSSVFRYKGKETEPQQIAAELGVDAVMTGRMVKRGENLFLSVNLIDARNNQSLWGEQYERKMSDLLNTQREIAAEITNKLHLKLSGADEKKLAKNYTDNAEAYQLYLKGRFHLLKTTRAGFQTAIPYFQQAIDIDSSYALAYVGLADAYRSLALAGEFPAREVMPKAKAAANKALEIDTALAEAHAVLGFIIFWHDWDWNAAENQFKRALELDPNNGDTLIFYAGLLSNTGRHAEALAEARRARELDPLNLRTNVLEAQYLIYAGNIDEALARLQKTLELDPNYWFAHQFRATALIEKGMYAEAVAAARKSLESNFVTRTISFLAYALAKSGKQAEAWAELEKLLKLSRESYVPPFNIALIYNGLGERDETLRWLERGIEERDPRMTFLKVEPKWSNLRDDARFQNLARRVGLNSAAQSTNGEAKFYWQMSDAEQLAFIEKRAAHVQTLIGDEPSDLDEDALRAIKIEIDDYVEEKDSLSQKPFEEGLRFIYGRASQFAPIITKAYEARRIAPALGLYQAMIESEYHDCLKSPTGNVGLFQFKPSTARKYGLMPKDFCNVEKQADAAAAYMSDLTSDFVSEKSSATLGLLGFVVGENGTRDYLRQLRGRGVAERSFWAILRHGQDLQPPLSEDEKTYVPRFFAAAVIGETPRIFDLSAPPLTTLHNFSPPN